MDIIDAEDMAYYWQAQQINAEKALDYAKDQRAFWLAKLATARAVEIVQDGTETW